MGTKPDLVVNSDSEVTEESDRTQLLEQLNLLIKG